MTLKKIDKNTWEIPKTGKMKVAGVIYASEKLLKDIEKDGKTIEQIKNVASLPGIVGKSYAMPDAHMGYGFSIGGVAGFDMEKGVISPGGVGYDINCGVRLLRTGIKVEDLEKKKEDVLNDLNRSIPSGVGRGGDIKLSDKEVDDVLVKGAKWAVEKGYGIAEDLERIEDNGCIKGADASKVSMKAKGRGRGQLGTLGAGNHFIEIQEVSQVFDEDVASVFGLVKGEVVVMIHTGSRGLGHQTASDYIHFMEKEYGIKGLPDRELICAPIKSKLGKDYFGAMSAAANFAFANRQVMTSKVRDVLKKAFPKSDTKVHCNDCGTLDTQKSKKKQKRLPSVEVVYDVAHNIAKFEKHLVNGKMQEVCLHRKGATRSFGPGHVELPEVYQKTGQPVILPGSMGTASYVLVGTNKAEEVSFGSTAHGAGRIMSRTAAKQSLSASDVKEELKKKGISVRAGSAKGLVEEAPAAYKDIDEVVKVSHDVGIGKLVAKLRPLAVIKG